ncbi:MAG: hypothetical protein WDN00_07180 [Limisphaerales bacterium]
MKALRPGIIVSALPSLIMLGLFYSLALHMRWSLGEWPTSIGERGFPPSLLSHVNVTVLYFEALFLSMFFLVPAAIVVCLLVERWRRFVPYLALCSVLFLISWEFMQFAPDQFLYWWRD